MAKKPEHPMVVTSSTEPSTRSGRLFATLRNDILGGKLKPGSRLPFAELSVTYNSSIGTLREALQRLAELGLAETIAQQGFRVVAVSAEDLQDLTDARLEIEVAALRHSIRDGDVAWEARAVAAHHVLERAPVLEANASDRFSEEWATAHSAFHQALLSGCSNRRLLSSAASLRDSAELYRRWSIPFGRDKTRDSHGEHRALLDAAVNRNVEAAAELLREHISRTTYTQLPQFDRDGKS